ncbi:MAG: outer membrane protein assembly factor BamE [Rhodobacteraceae bacterium]|nr:outer membrane protein assembly factor BamE [Paracoccaceae bacterium]
MSKSGFVKFFGIPVFIAMLSACAPQVDIHGYVPVATDVASIAPGQDSQETVLVLLGEPTTRGAQGSDTWYYISSTVHRVAFFAPREVNRQIVAIQFAQSGKVIAVDRFGLEDGRVIDLNRNTTVTDGRRLTFFEQLLGNIGNFSAEQFIGG